MEYYSVLKVLYHDSLRSIIDLLNVSVYVTDFEEKNFFVIHTGFSFYTQTGQELEVLYNFSSHKTIIQPRNQGHGLSLPKINGLNVIQEENNNEVYFNRIFPMHIYEFHYTDVERFFVMLMDENYLSTLWDKSEINQIQGKNGHDNKVIKVRKIKVFNNIKGKISKENFPLNKILKHQIFLDPNGWKFRIDKYYDLENDYR